MWYFGGAINGWIVINHVQFKMNQGCSVTDSWKGSFKKLLDFWDYTSSSPDFTKWGPYSIALEVERIPGFPPYSMWKWPSDEKVWISRWNKEHEKTNNSIATGEAARRYYCSKEYLYSGADNVFSHAEESMITGFSMISFLLQIHGTNITTSL